MIHSRALPQDAMVKIDANAKPCATGSGTYNANQSVHSAIGTLARAPSVSVATISFHCRQQLCCLLENDGVTASLYIPHR